MTILLILCEMIAVGLCSFRPQIISNQDLFDECQQESIETTIARRRWRWIGHILRKDQGSIPRVAVEWKPEGHRKRGRPRMTWRRTVEAEATAMGHSWGTLRTLAQDRLRWREFVAALVVYDKKGKAQPNDNMAAPVKVLEELKPTAIQRAPLCVKTGF